uniref:Uncharacterized protein n=1 Tax=Glossina austeni TaxID=7395 RepID=A0A1A9V319_GLOAU
MVEKVAYVHRLGIASSNLIYILKSLAQTKHQLGKIYTSTRFKSVVLLFALITLHGHLLPYDNSFQVIRLLVQPSTNHRTIATTIEDKIHSSLMSSHERMDLLNISYLIQSIDYKGKYHGMLGFRCSIELTTRISTTHRQVDV